MSVSSLGQTIGGPRAPLIPDVLRGRIPCSPGPMDDTRARAGLPAAPPPRGAADPHGDPLFGAWRRALGAYAEALAAYAAEADETGRRMLGARWAGARREVAEAATLAAEGEPPG